MFAFVFFPRGRYAEAKVFLHRDHSLISEFDTEELEQTVINLYSEGYQDITDFQFLEVGRYNPISFEKTISYTINQGD